MASLTSQSDVIWDCILFYLEPSDLQNLLFVNKSVKEKVQHHLYHELTLTEWASSGAQLAMGIHRGIVSDETCECVEKLRFRFTSIEEISEALRLSLEIQPKMSNIRAIEIEAHKTEDALVVVGILVQKYRQCSIINVVARAPSEGPLPMAASTLPLITSLRVPRLLRSEVLMLASISELELDEVCDDSNAETISEKQSANSGDGAGASALLNRQNNVDNSFVGSESGSSSFVFDRLSIPYATYVKLGSPSAVQLELRMDKSDEEVNINDFACTVLKLSTVYDLPQLVFKLRTPSLRVLILCNIAPLPTIRLVDSFSMETVEFLSIAPVTLPALQALANKSFLPSLKLLLVLVSSASFLSDSPLLLKRETRKLAEWLQVLAAHYPVDVRDFSWRLRQDIYFSDGLWCLAAQTRYWKYLPLVVPPPLKSH